MQVAGGGQQNAVTVDHAASGIAEQGAVGIAVESYAEIKLASGVRHHFPQGIRVQRAAAFVDIFSVGGDVDEGCLNAETAKQFGSLGSSGAVGAIHENAQLA
jgi:hypothetical protein